MNSLVVFEDAKALNKFLRSPSGAALDGNTVYFSNNVKCVRKIRQCEKKAFLPEELVSQEAESIERESQSRAEGFYKANGVDYSSRNNISFGFAIEYYLILEISRLLKLVVAIENLFRDFAFKTVYVISPGSFCETIRDILAQKSIAYTYVSSSLLRKVLCEIRIWKENGEKNKWFGKRFRVFFGEPLFEYFLLARGTLKALFSRRKTPAGTILLISGNRFLYPVYKQLKVDGRITVAVCGHTYPGRKLFVREKVLNIESSLTLSLWKEFITACCYFYKSWAHARKDRLLRNKFVFHGIQLWNMLRKVAGLHMIVSLPRLYLMYRLADSFFESNEVSALLLASDCSPYDRCMIMAAKNRGVHSAVVQHGQLIEPCGHNKIFADNIFVWGEAAKKWYECYGNKPERCIVTGSPKYDDIVDRLSGGFDPERTRRMLGILPTVKVISVLTNFASGFCAHFSELDIFYMIESVLEATCLEKDVFVVVKLHPGETLKYYRDLCREMKRKYKNFAITRDVDLLELLHISSMIISWYSTTVLDAMFLEKPAVIFDMAKRRSLVPYEECGVAVKVRCKEDMRSAIAGILYDENKKKKICMAQDKFLSEYCHRGSMTATDSICEVLFKK